MIGVDRAYLAGVFDTAGTLSMRVDQHDRYSIGYRLRPQVFLNRPESRRVALDRFGEYCDEQDITHRIEDRSDRESVRIVISGIDNMQTLLSDFEEYLIQQREAVTIMLDEILPALEAGTHHTKAGFVEIMDAVDRLREHHLQPVPTKYDADYFRSEWGDDLD